MDHSRIQPGPHRAAVIWVPGIAAQQGSKTLGRNRKTGQAVMYESAKGLPAWRKLVIAQARATVGPGWVPLDGPLDLTAHFWLPRPVSHPKTIDTYPTSPPDLDKLVRAVGDSLTQANVIADDARIVYLEAREFYAGPPLAPSHPDPGVSIRAEMLR